MIIRHLLSNLGGMKMSGERYRIVQELSPALRWQDFKVAPEIVWQTTQELAGGYRKLAQTGSEQLPASMTAWMNQKMQGNWQDRREDGAHALFGGLIDPWVMRKTGMMPRFGEFREVEIEGDLLVVQSMGLVETVTPDVLVENDSPVKGAVSLSADPFPFALASEGRVNERSLRAWRTLIGRHAGSYQMAKEFWQEDVTAGEERAVGQRQYDRARVQLGRVVASLGEVAEEVYSDKLDDETVAILLLPWFLKSAEALLSRATVLMSGQNGLQTSRG